MPKLNKRETIIIAVTFIVVLYGAYAGLSSMKIQKYAKENYPAGKNNYMDTIAGDLLKNPSNVTEAYIISRAEVEWRKNPFWKNNSYREWAEKDNTKIKDDPASKIIYSGYVDSGKKKMAVINGLEYSVGEKLEIEGYVLKKITSARIVIGNKKNGSDLVISIQE